MNSELLEIYDFSALLDILASVITYCPLSPATPGHRKITLCIVQKGDQRDWQEDNINAEYMIVEHLFTFPYWQNKSQSVSFNYHRISKLHTFNFSYSHQTGQPAKLCQGSCACSQGWSLLRHVSQYLPAHPNLSYTTLDNFFLSYLHIGTSQLAKSYKWRPMFGYFGALWVKTWY